MRYRRLLMGGFLAVGLAVTADSGAMAEQIIAINSTVEAVDGQATPVTDAIQNDQDGAKGSQATENPAAGTDKTQSTENKADGSQKESDAVQNTETSAAKPDPASQIPITFLFCIRVSLLWRLLI